MKIKLAIFLILTSAFIVNAYAGSATWKTTPRDGTWETSANWTPRTVPNGPSDIATFGASSTTTISASGAIEVDGFVFNPGASAFTITSHPEDVFAFSGAGITNNSGLEQSFVTASFTGVINFANNATAGSQTVFTNAGGGVGSDGGIFFLDNSNAGSGTFVNGNAPFEGDIFFTGTSSAANGIFTNMGSSSAFSDGGYISFQDNSTAASGIFTNKGRMSDDARVGGLISFSGEATAANGTFTNEGNGYQIVADDGGDIRFGNTSTAGNATFTNEGAVVSGEIGGGINFLDESSAGDATIICNGGQVSGGGGGLVQFINTATADSATLIANAGLNGGDGGVVKFSTSSKGSAAKVMVFGNGLLDISAESTLTAFPKTIGSLEGDGQVLLGTSSVPNSLTVGANDQNTTFSGTIEGAGVFSKSGNGTLVLTGTSNNFLGQTFVNAGTLIVNNRSGNATGVNGGVSVYGGTLAGNGIISQPVTVYEEGILSPGNGPRKPGILTIQNALDFESSTFAFAINTRTGLANGVIANGVFLTNAQLSAGAAGNSTLAAGTVFTVINNTSSDAIVGTFANLPRGGTITVGHNTLRANYRGGDGNDLTLTVIQ